MSKDIGLVERIYGFNWASVSGRAVAVRAHLDSEEALEAVGLSS